MKLILSTVGWWVVFKVLAKVIEIVLLPEAEAAELLASFIVWSIQTVQSGVEVGQKCRTGVCSPALAEGVGA